jgi:hypothetical protein
MMWSSDLNGPSKRRKSKTFYQKLINQLSKSFKALYKRTSTELILMLLNNTLSKQKPVRGTPLPHSMNWSHRVYKDWRNVKCREWKSWMRTSSMRTKTISSSIQDSTSCVVLKVLNFLVVRSKESLLPELLLKTLRSLFLMKLPVLWTSTVRRSCSKP